MTTKEKAKAYDEALKRARKIHSEIVNNELLGFPGQIEDIFPQLRESEDERIKKIITDSVFFQYGAGVEYKDVLDYLDKLEKQKEQKHPDGCFTCDEYKKGYEEGRRNGFTAGYNKAMKEVEQKQEYPLTPDECIKPTEWSEEDERIIDTIVSVLSQYIDYKSVSDTSSGSGSAYATPRYNKEIDWLNSLRPSWKPSEEHLSALLAVFNDPDNIGSQTCQLALTDLYEQLKKL